MELRVPVIKEVDGAKIRIRRLEKSNTLEFRLVKNNKSAVCFFTFRDEQITSPGSGDSDENGNDAIILASVANIENIEGTLRQFNRKFEEYTEKLNSTKLITSPRECPYLTIENRTKIYCLHVVYPTGDVAEFTDWYNDNLSDGWKDHCIVPKNFHDLAVELGFKYDPQTFERICEHFKYEYLDYADNPDVIIPAEYLPEQTYNGAGELIPMSLAISEDINKI